MNASIHTLTRPYYIHQQAIIRIFLFIIISPVPINFATVQLSRASNM
jgi:hypothetical protein